MRQLRRLGQKLAADKFISLCPNEYVSHLF